MADAALIIGWGMPRPGREQLGVGVILGAVRLFQSMVEAGRLERVDVFVTDGCAELSDGGSLVVTGTNEQIDGLVDDTECRAMLLRGIHVAQDFRVNRAATGASLIERLGRLAGIDAAHALQ